MQRLLLTRHMRKKWVLHFYEGNQKTFLTARKVFYVVLSICLNRLADEELKLICDW